jgi:hypothetical protein
VNQPFTVKSQLSMPEKPQPNPDELRIENELHKLQLEQEFGAVFGGFTTDLPPDIENRFLRNVLEFERQYKSGGTLTMYEFLGRPHLYPPEELRSEEDFRAEVNRLFELFEQNSVRLDVLGTYPAETLYRFIVDEFMHLEKDNIRIPGMYSGYIYEEFHPNHRLDIDRRVRDLFEWLTEVDRPENFYGFDDAIEDHRGQTWTRAQLISELRAFRRGFNRLEIVRLDFEKFEFDETTGLAELRLFVELEGRRGGDKFWFIKDFAEIELRCEYNYWSISKFKLPALWL